MQFQLISVAMSSPLTAVIQLFLVGVLLLLYILTLSIAEGIVSGSMPVSIAFKKIWAAISNAAKRWASNFGFY